MEKKLDIEQIRPVVEKLDEQEKKLRRKIIENIARKKEVYKPADEEKKIAQSLVEKNVIDKIEAESAYPVSLKETNKKAHILKEDLEVNAMCAIDALGLCFTFDSNVELKLQCEESKEEILITIKDKVIQNPDKELRFLYKDLNKCDTWSCCCCNVMHVFKNQEYFNLWLVKHLADTEDIYCLDETEAFKVAKNLFKE